MFLSLTFAPVNPTPGSPLGPAAPTGPRSPCVNRHLSNHSGAVGGCKKKMYKYVCLVFWYLLSLKTCTRSPEWTRNAWRPLATLGRQCHFQFNNKKYNHPQPFFKNDGYTKVDVSMCLQIIFIFCKIFALYQYRKAVLK